MKIVSWNCNGKFREKYKEIDKLKADIYVIQECEDPKQANSLEYLKFSANHIWIGSNKNKGLGIFAKENIKLMENDWSSYCLKYFLSVNVNDKFDLIGVWACKHHIEEYYIYQNINIKNFNQNTIIIGDFNSNASWDKKHHERNHSNVVKELDEIGLVSVYHYVFNEEQGKETKKTFYLYKHLNRPYHIDHCFMNKSNIKKYDVLDNTEWLKFSDHTPICLETND